MDPRHQIPVLQQGNPRKGLSIKTPPKTWDELTEQAKTIKDKGLLATPIAWSWSQAEAAICDYTTLVSAFGGDFLKDGK